MSITASIPWDDTVLPFQLDRSNARGRIARLDGVLEQILSQHDYPLPVEALVAEMALLTALIGQTIKLRWRLSLQVRGNGPVRMIATDYYAPDEDGNPAKIRGYANFEADAIGSQNPFDLIEGGYFGITIDQGSDMLPYQGITPVTGSSIAHCAETYFAQSEQLPTKFVLGFGQSTLAGDQERWRGGGLMIQVMPRSPVITNEGGASGDAGLLTAEDILTDLEGADWRRVTDGLSTVTDFELIGPSVPPTELLMRLFQGDGPRVFPVQPVRFGCSCSATKVTDNLVGLTAGEIADLTTEAGVVTADCQFCGAHYEFDPATLGYRPAASGAPNG